MGKIIFLFLFSISTGYSEDKYNVDSMFSTFFDFSKNENNFSKCGRVEINYLRQNFEKLSAKNKIEFEKYLNKNFQFDTLIGNFLIKFDTSGIDATTIAFVESVGVYLNYSYQFHIDSLHENNILTPINVKIKSLGNKYGYVENLTIYLDNDYKNFPTSGFDGAKVTAAHELHHMFQIINYETYSYPYPINFYMELTAVGIEEEIYDDINDYFNYVRTPDSHFGNPNLEFNYFDSRGSIQYSRVVWIKFLHDKFLKLYNTKDTARSIIKKSWEFIKNDVDIYSVIYSSLLRFGGFGKKFAEFSYWNFFIGENFDYAKSYIEGENYFWFYPLENGYVVKMNHPQYETAKNITSNAFILKDTSFGKYYSKYFPINYNGDTIITCVTRHSFDDYEIKIRYRIQFVEGDETYHKLPNNMYSRLEMYNENNNKWEIADTSLFSFYEVVKRKNTVDAVVVEPLLVYPNPFIYDGENTVKFQLPQNVEKKISLQIFTNNFVSVFSQNNLETKNGNSDIGYDNKFVEWNGKTNDGIVISSGVYFYLMTYKDETKWFGKFAIIR